MEFAACGATPRPLDAMRRETGDPGAAEIDRAGRRASSPLTTLNIEVLPAPFGPITQKIPAWSKSTESRSRMVTSPTRTLTSRRARVSPAAARPRSPARRSRACLRLRGGKRRSSGSANAGNAARKHQHDGDEEQRHQHFPERKAVAQLRGERADDQRADHRAEQAGAAADGRPDHEIGGEPEAEQLRRDDALLRRVDRAADAGHQAADAEGHGLEPVGVEAEQLQAAFVLRERAPQHADRRVVEPAGKRRARASKIAAET